MYPHLQIKIANSVEMPYGDRSLRHLLSSRPDESNLPNVDTLVEGDVVKNKITGQPVIDAQGNVARRTGIKQEIYHAQNQA